MLEISSKAILTCRVMIFVFQDGETAKHGAGAYRCMHDVETCSDIQDTLHGAIDGL